MPCRSEENIFIGQNQCVKGEKSNETQTCVCVCVAGERGDGGETGAAVSTHCVQYSDAGLQENAGESLSDGLEPQHVHSILTHTHTHVCILIDTLFILPSFMK